jgi:hypothetical protein
MPEDLVCAHLCKLVCQAWRSEIDVCPVDVMYIDAVNYSICDKLSISTHPTCKVGLFLQLRATHRLGWKLANGLVLVDRIHHCVTKEHANGQPIQLVQNWAKRVINSGWIHQLWPAVRVRHDGQHLKKDPVRGLPHGMRQHYFDAANDEKKILGWKVNRQKPTVPHGWSVDEVCMELTL